MHRQPWEPHPYTSRRTRVPTSRRHMTRSCTPERLTPSRNNAAIWLATIRAHIRPPLRGCLGMAPYTVSVLRTAAFMPKPVPLPPPGFDELSVDEKIDYLQSLWDRIAASPETIPVPDRHGEILDKRLKDLEADPDAGDSWEVVQERLRKKLDGRH